MQPTPNEPSTSIDKPTSDLIFQYLNSLRTRPVEYIDKFDNLQTELKNQKKTNAFIKSFTNFIDELKSKPSRSLQKNGILNELAAEVAEKLDMFNDESYLRTLIAENYSGVTFLSSHFIHDEETNTEKIINDLLLSESNRNDFFLNNSFKLVGIFHRKSDDDSNKSKTVIIIADEINEGSEHTFVERIVKELNKFRSLPSSYISILDDYKTKTLKEFPNTKREIVQDLGLFVDSLKRRNTIRSFTQITNSEGLNAAASEHLDLLEQNNTRKFFAQDEEYLSILLSHYVSGYYECREFIATDIYQPKNIIVDFLVNEKDPDKQARRALINASLCHVGIAHRIIRGTRVTVVVFTDKADNIKPLTFEEGLIHEINRIRAYPRSYIKYFQSMIDNNEIARNSTKKQQEAFIKNVSETVEFLQNARSLAPLIINYELNSAAEMKVNKFMSEGKVATNSDERLREFLGDYGKGFYNVAQLDYSGSQDPIEFLKDVIIPRNANRSYRDIIFSRYFNYIGVAGSPERVYDDMEEQVEGEEKVSILLLTDYFENLTEKFDTSVISRQVVLKRPNLTNDEIIQIKSDFKLFDVTNSGYVKPGPLIFFMDKSANFSKFNFIYYEAFKHLNTEENNSNGVNVEEFISAIRKIFFFVYQENRWKELYDIYYGDNRKKVIDYDVLKRITTELKYKITDEDLLVVLERLKDSDSLDLAKFTEIMKVVENLGRIN